MAIGEKKHYELMSAETLQAEIERQQKLKKIFGILTIITTILFLVGIALFALTSLNNPLVVIITFALFITCFMLYAYARQNLGILEEMAQK